MGRCLQLMTPSFILVPAGAVRPAVVWSGHRIASHRGARRGGLQARRERRPGPKVPEVLIEASTNIVEKAESVWVIAVHRPVPRLGDSPSFYRPRREQFTCVPHYFPMCGGVASSATELMAVLANPAPLRASWRVLCSYRSGFEGGGVVVGRPAAAASRFEGAVNGAPVRGTVAVMATSCPRALQQHRDVVTGPGVARHWRGWPHRVDSDGKDRTHRPDVTTWPCVITEKVIEGTADPPSRARRVSRTGVGDAVSRD
jgi:hypothetical protein